MPVAESRESGRPVGTVEPATLAPTDVAAGLSTDDVETRRARYGRNTLPDTKRRGLARVVLAQFRDVMVILLLVAGAVAAFLGETADLVAIILIVVLNAVFGAVQEFRAERALESLRALAAPLARVRRNSTVMTVPSADVVPGDVVLLEAGNIVPADLRLVEASNLDVAEALLTGEAEPVHKTAEPLPLSGAPDGEQPNAAFQGTTVTRGRGTGIVTATGSRTRLGAIAELLRDEGQPRTPLQHRLDQLARRLSIVVAVLCAIVFAAGILRDEPVMTILMTALSMGVAAIPEALPAVVAMTLAIGARRLVRHNALIRQLPAVETLGSVTFICADKTGTLTENRMRVESVMDGRGRRIAAADGDASLDPRLLEAMAISNDAFVSSNGDVAGDVTGDPTEVALCVFAAKAGYSKREIEARLPRIAELPFTSDRACMTTLHQASGDDAGIVVFTKGAPERVLPNCDRWQFAKADELFDRSAVRRLADDLAGDGLRVLAVATREIPTLPAELMAVEQHQSLLGLVGILDPPRAEAKDAVELCQSAGIRVVMITGDHAETALSIARRVGIASGEGSLLTGSQLHTLSDPELEQLVGDLRVYARVSPVDKIRIVKALQSRGEFVAMTGDGVNDAPALHRANIGIAMGRGGTDVARESAAMVLLDDNFATIVAAVREGRRIYDNIRKFIRYILACNVGEVFALVLAPLLGLPLPLLPIQILWINLVTDGLPGLALVAEPPERDVMQRPPRAPNEGVFAHGMWQHVLWVGVLIGGATLTVQAFALAAHAAHWRSMTFTVLTFAQMAQVLSVRSEHQSVFRLGILSNRPLVAAAALTVGLQIAILYIAPLQSVFRTEALTLKELALVVATSAFILAAVEVEKLIRRRRLNREHQQSL